VTSYINSPTIGTYSNIIVDNKICKIQEYYNLLSNCLPICFKICYLFTFGITTAVSSVQFIIGKIPSIEIDNCSKCGVEWVFCRGANYQN